MILNKIKQKITPRTLFQKQQLKLKRIDNVVLSFTCFAAMYFIIQVILAF